MKESETDFETAWRLQEARARGDSVPPTGVEPALFQYGAICSLGAQLQRTVEHVPAEQLKVIVFDDFQADPRAVYEDVLAFLSLPSDGRREFPRINAGRENRSTFIRRLFVSPPGPIRAVLRPLKRIPAARSASYSALAWIRNLNSRAVERPAISDELRRELSAWFADDVAKLGRILGRDLGHWLRP